MITLIKIRVFLVIIVCNNNMIKIVIVVVMIIILISVVYNNSKADNSDRNNSNNSSNNINFHNHGKEYKKLSYIRFFLQISHSISIAYCSKKMSMISWPLQSWIGNHFKVYGRYLRHRRRGIVLINSPLHFVIPRRCS